MLDIWKQSISETFGVQPKGKINVLDLLYEMLPVVEDAKFDTSYKKGSMTKLESKILDAIEQMEGK